MKFLLYISVLISLLACGRDDGSDSDSGDESSILTISLESTEDLPECLDSNNNQLAYVKDEKRFYECQDGDWSSIVVVNGDWPSNVWVDAVTGYAWQAGTDLNWSDASKSCTDGWVMPTAEEGITAANHGMDTIDFWTSDKVGIFSAYIIGTVSQIPGKIEENRGDLFTSVCVYK